MYSLKRKFMTKAKLEYLSRVFIGFSDETQDHVLNTARQLVKIQDDNIFLLNDNIEEFTLLKSRLGGNYEKQQI